MSIRIYASSERMGSTEESLHLTSPFLKSVQWKDDLLRRIFDGYYEEEFDLTVEYHLNDSIGFVLNFLQLGHSVYVGFYDEKTHISFQLQMMLVDKAGTSLRFMINGFPEILPISNQVKPLNYYIS